jgi:hypothetical protein
MLLSASKKAGYPVVELTTDTKGLDLLEKYLVVNLIKGFAEVEVEHVSIFVEVEIAYDILDVMEKLSEAVLAFLETVLIRFEHDVAFKEADHLVAHDAFTEFDEVRSQ